MNGMKTPFKLDKQVILIVGASVFVIAVLSILYFGGLFNKEVAVENTEEKTISGGQLEIYCQGFDSLPKAEQDDYAEKLRIVFATPTLTKEQLNELLPPDCKATNF